MKTVSRTTQFKRDFKRMVKRGKEPAELRSVVETLCRGAKLPPKYRDHQLSGKWNKHRECHIEPDWLLIYRSTERGHFGKNRLAFRPVQMSDLMWWKTGPNEC